MTLWCDRLKHGAIADGARLKHVAAPVVAWLGYNAHVTPDVEQAVRLEERRRRRRILRPERRHPAPRAPRISGSNCRTVGTNLAAPPREAPPRVEVPRLFAAAAFRRHVAPDDGASSARRPADTILGSCSRCLAQPLGRRAASWCSICCASSRSHCSTQQARQTLGQRAAHSAAPRARVAPPPRRGRRTPLSALRWALGAGVLGQAASECANGCSGNGRCVEGVCECYPSFTYFDCSLSAPLAPAPQFFAPLPQPPPRRARRGLPGQLRWSSRGLLQRHVPLRRGPVRRRLFEEVLPQRVLWARRVQARLEPEANVLLPPGLRRRRLQHARVPVQHARP